MNLQGNYNTEIANKFFENVEIFRKEETYKKIKLSL
jgi:hypothetical protein